MDTRTTARPSFFSPTLGAVGLLIVGTLVFACIVTPPVQSGLFALLGEHRWPFSRVFDRVALVGAIAMAYLLRRQLRLGELFSGRRGWRKPRVLRTVLVAAVISLLASMIGLPVIAAAGKGTWQERSVTDVVWRVIEVAPAALIISLIEESFFRGLLFKRMITEIGVVAAAVVSSALYALAHVTASNRHWVYEGWTPTIGFEYLASLVQRVWGLGVGLALIGLFLVGCTLCMTMLRSRGLAACIGLHSGWVLATKLASFLMKPDVDVALPRGLGRYYLLTQPVVWLTIGLVALVSWLLFRPRAASADA